jgi:hypothetical protein
MNWISHLNTATIVLLSVDAASLGISTLVFSERVRGFVRRRRWGLLHGVIPHIDTIELPPIDDAPKKSMRVSVTILHNPFDPKARDHAAEPSPSPMHTEESHRPSFRKSVALQQRIAHYENLIARFAPGAAQNPGAGAPNIESIRISLLVSSSDSSSETALEQAFPC